MTDADAVTSEMTATPDTRRRWRRSAGDRYLAGVAAGLARFLDVDPLLVRIALVIGAVFSPVVLIGYAAVWLLIPVEGEPRSLLRSIRKPSAFREALAAVGLVIGAAIVLPDMRPGGSPGLRFGLILIAAGTLLLVRPQFRYPQGGADAEMGTSVAPPATTRRPRGASRVPRAERPASSLGLLAVSLLVLAVGVAAAVDQSNRDVSLGVVSSVALVVVGGALTLSGWFGRARGLILLAPVLVAAWIAFAPANVVLYPGNGERSYTITSAADIAANYRLGFGSLHVYAGEARFAPNQKVALDARTTAGRVRIDVPADARLRVVGRIGLGAFHVYDDRRGWSQQMLDRPAINRRIDQRWSALAPICEQNESYPPFAPEPLPARVDNFGRPCLPVPPREDAPEVTVRVTLGTGYLEVHRVPPPG